MLSSPRGVRGIHSSGREERGSQASTARASKAWNSALAFAHCVSKSPQKPGAPDRVEAQQHPQQPARTLLRAAPAGKADFHAAKKRF